MESGIFVFKCSHQSYHASIHDGARMWHNVKHSPQRRERCTMHRGYKDVVEAVVWKACIYQGNLLALFLIKGGDPSLRTCVNRIRTPFLLEVRA